MVLSKHCIFDNDEDHTPFAQATPIGDENNPQTRTSFTCTASAAAAPTAASNAVAEGSGNSNGSGSRTRGGIGVAAGTAGAVLGFMIGGPIFATLAGVGAAYASQQRGAAGDAARALGDVALTTAEKAKQIDEKHRLVEKTKKAASAAWNAEEYESDDEPVENQNETETESSSPSTSDGGNSARDRVKVASGAAGAVLGFFIGGPIVAAVAGVGLAFASQKRGAAGDAARALGDVAMTTAEKAKEIDQKHNVVERSKKAATDAWENAREYDKRNNVVNKVKDAMVHSWLSFSNYIRENRVLERSAQGIGRGIEYVTDRVTPQDNTITATTTTNNNETPPQTRARLY